MTRFLLLTLLCSLSPLALADDGHDHAAPPKLQRFAPAPEDDSDLPKPFKMPVAEKANVPPYLGLFGSEELIEKAGFASAPGRYVEYELVSTKGAGEIGSAKMKIAHVGPSPAGARWIEMLVTAEGVGTAGIRLLTRGDKNGNLERIVAKSPEMPPIEFPIDTVDVSVLSGGPGSGLAGNAKLRLVGKEQVKVPLGTFMTQHYVLENNGGSYDFWIADDRSLPFTRAVKFTTDEGTAVAVKVGDDAVGTILVPGARRPHQ